MFSLVGLLEMLGTVLCSCGVYMYVKDGLGSYKGYCTWGNDLGLACLRLAEAPL